ncbi:MAG: hypothetical protein ACP5O7_05940 [Phycisphaerae bacterium]
MSGITSSQRRLEAIASRAMQIILSCTDSRAIKRIADQESGQDCHVDTTQKTNYATARRNKNIIPIYHIGMMLQQAF